MVVTNVLTIFFKVTWAKKLTSYIYIYIYMFSHVQKNRKVKIAIIDSGIDHVFEAFLCDGKKMEEFHDCNELELQDT